MDNLTLYNVPDYQALLESLFTFFENFLLSQHVSAVSRKNYRSDLRDFIDWAVQTIQLSDVSANETPAIFLKKLPEEKIEEYKRSLSLRHVPAATINRRLSTIRKFFAAAFSYGLIDTNPALGVRNISSSEPMDIHGILTKFRQSLIDEGASDITVKNYVSDVREFLQWMGQKPIGIA